ncbi:MAG: glycosyltransferase family 2 protein [Bacteroides sp.]|nr:glycosyltransferase family 2 protein [Bacteroides sp.]
MILSIGMIVKNEEKYLEKCLEALKPILDSVESELIIADTGSTDKTFEIAEKYTDNVYRFEWTNDFSAARNSTLERARGEWYMFIDADEIFRDCSELIRFFNSGEYKKYYTASFVVRSYTVVSNGEIDRNYFSDFSALRLTVRKEGIYFENPIHEQLSMYIRPVKTLNVIADHYGYLFFNEEDRIKKSERNLKPLLDELEALNGKEPTDNYLIYKQIADAYSLVNNKEKEREYIDLGLKSISHDNLRIAAYYTKKAVLLYFDDKNYEEVIELCNDFFNKETNPSRKSRLISDITMYAYKGRAEYRLEKYREAVSDFCDFFELYEDHKNNRLNADDAFFDTLYVMESDVLDIYNMFLKSCISERRYSLANKYLKSFDIREAVKDNNYGDYVNNYIRYAVSVMKNSSFNNLSCVLNQLDGDRKNLLLSEARRSVFGADEEKRENILKNLEAVARSSPAAEKTALIFRGYIEGNNIDKALINNFIKKYGTSSNEDIMCVLMEKDMDISVFVNAEDYDPKETAYSIFKIHDKPLELFENYNVDNISEKGLEKAAETYKYAMMKATDYSSPISQMLIRQGILKKTDISGLLKKYASIGYRYLNESKEKNTPWEIKAADLAYKIVRAREEEDYDRCLEELHIIIMLYPEFNNILNDYREKIKNERTPPLSEFEQMAIQVKHNIRNMIKSGNYADAMEVLREYQSLCPNDGEAEIIRSELNGLINK